MKNLIPLLACVILFSSCQQSKDDMVNDLLNAENSFNKEAINQLLADSFMYYGRDTLNKEEYLSRLDSLKYTDSQSEIINIQHLDSIVKTEEQFCDIIESQLGVTPLIVQKRTYRFAGDKILSITVDSILNYDECVKSLIEKWIPFAYYLKDKYGIDDWNEIAPNLKQYLSEYTSLPSSDKKQYKAYAYLQGTYVSDDCFFYKKLIFKGEKTVTIIDAILGFPFSTSYELDGDIVKVMTDRGELLFDIQDSQTLIGEGFAKGTYVKVND